MIVLYESFLCRTFMACCIHMPQEKIINYQQQCLQREEARVPCYMIRITKKPTAILSGHLWTLSLVSYIENRYNSINVVIVGCSGSPGKWHSWQSSSACPTHRGQERWHQSSWSLASKWSQSRCHFQIWIHTPSHCRSLWKWKHCSTAFTEKC